MKLSDLPDLESDCFHKHWKDDQAMLSILASKGNNADIKREIDFAFKGLRSTLNYLALNCEELGFDRHDIICEKDGDHWLIFYRHMKPSNNSLKPLIKLCLQLENKFDLDFDGWGCEVRD